MVKISFDLHFNNLSYLGDFEVHENIIVYKTDLFNDISRAYNLDFLSKNIYSGYQADDNLLIVPYDTSITKLNYIIKNSNLNYIGYTSDEFCRMGFFDKKVCQDLTVENSNYCLDFENLKNGILYNTNLIKAKPENIESNKNFGVIMYSNANGNKQKNLCFANEECAIILGGKTIERLHLNYS